MWTSGWLLLRLRHIRQRSGPAARDTVVLGRLGIRSLIVRVKASVAGQYTHIRERSAGLGLLAPSRARVHCPGRELRIQISNMANAWRITGVRLVRRPNAKFRVLSSPMSYFSYLKDIIGLTNCHIAERIALSDIAHIECQTGMDAWSIAFVIY